MNDRRNLSQLSRQPSADERFYSPQLDGLRFLAALFLFVDHAPALPVLRLLAPYGWLGIDLFLGLSGFLITRLLLLEHQRTGVISVKAFYVRRALRIWPLYFGFATAVCAWTLVRGKIEPTVVLASWLSHLSFTNNLLTAVHGWNRVPWTIQLWTISLEEQAYLVLPLAVLAIVATRPKVRAIVGVSFAAIILLMAARLAFFLAGSSSLFIYVLPLRADAFIFGFLAAALLDRGSLRPRPWMLPLGVLLMAAALLFSPLDQPSWYDVFGYSVTALGAVAIVFGSQTRFFFASPLASLPMRYLGRISYGFYVFHILALAVARRAQQSAQLSDLATWLIGFAVTIAIASASYAFYEKPFLRLKKRFERVASRPI